MADEQLGDLTLTALEKELVKWLHLETYQTYSNLQKISKQVQLSAS
jgi:hypothetical protein